MEDSLVRIAFVIVFHLYGADNDQVRSLVACLWYLEGSLMKWVLVLILSGS